MAESTKENSYTPYLLNKYQEDAMSVRLPSADRLYVLLGISGEAGEVSSLAAKAIRDGIEDDEEFKKNMKKELGDVLWFVAAIAADNGYTLEDVARANIDKLFSRRDRGTLSGSGDNR